MSRRIELPLIKKPEDRTALELEVSDGLQLSCDQVVVGP